jgi:hypothetical protein
MKRIYLRFRILLMTFALGMAVVYMTNGLSIAWSEVPVELPKAKTTDVLHVFPVTARSIGGCDDYGDSGPTEALIRQQMVESRDLSQYDFGGYHGCGLNVEDWTSDRCVHTLKKARQFILKHWKEKKRGYVVVKYRSVDAESHSHIFIEPDENGNWRIVWTIERIFGLASCWGDVDKTADIRSVEQKRATRHDWEFEPGTLYLNMTDENGDRRTL